ncbi:MAG: TonB-dependent receptor [Moraxellaceae bacterium]|nr:MAG: TonB-dependent receptor [Moraxellaceae bacterium]
MVETKRLIKAIKKTVFMTALMLPTHLLLADEFDDEVFKMSLESLLNISVTAQKREERLVDVPVAVTLLNKKTIDLLNANNIEGLQALMPAVSFRKGNTTRNSAVTIRGVGTISFSIAAEPSVSTVVDGVVLGRSGQAFADMYDLERIEVLRGPQGTLFGKNASAGVLNITTQSPSDEFGLMVDTRILENNEYRTLTKFEGPITDDARASLSLLTAKFDGFVDNVYNNKMVNGYDRRGIRAKLDVDVSAEMTAKFIFESYHADDDCCADLEGRPSGRNPASEAAPDNSNGAGDLDLDQRSVDHDFLTRTVDKTEAFSVQLDRQWGDFDFTSITAHRVWDNTEYREGDFTSIGGDEASVVFGVPFQLHDIGPQSWRQFSQEFRIASPLGEKNVYQMGLFLWDMQSERDFTRFASCQDGKAQNDAILAANSGLTCNANDIVNASAFMTTHFQNYALFGEGRHYVINNGRILYGLRMTYDDVSYKHNRINNDAFGRAGVGVSAAADNTNFSNDEQEFNISLKLGFQYDLDDSSRVYATWVEGYKGPGFNVFYNMAEKDVSPIDPEESDAFELGYKTAQDTFFFNSAIFYTKFTGFQANNFDTSSGTTITRLTNAGEVVSKGLEIDFAWQATDDLKLYGGAAWVEAEIKKFKCPVGVDNCSSRSGADIPFSPDLKLALSADWTHTIDDTLGLILSGSTTYVAEQQSVLPNNDGSVDENAELPDYYQVNASAALSFNDDKFRVTLIGKNLTDKSHVTTYSGDNFRYQYPRDADRYFGLAFRANL